MILRRKIFIGITGISRYDLTPSAKRHEKLRAGYYKSCHIQVSNHLWVLSKPTDVTLIKHYLIIVIMRSAFAISLDAKKALRKGLQLLHTKKPADSCKKLDIDLYTRAFFLVLAIFACELDDLPRVWLMLRRCTVDASCRRWFRISLKGSKTRRWWSRT